jgi:hypothetical protein
MTQNPDQKTRSVHDTTRNPMPGDIISARYCWSQDRDQEPGKKIRPCMVIKAAPDGSSMIIAPISTKQNWEANDCIEIMPPDRKAAGLDEDIRSWVKLTEINRVDLPNLAVIPHHTPDGRLMWSRGRVSDEILQHVQSEIAHGVHNKTLTGKHIKSDKMPAMQLSGVRVIKKDKEPSRSEVIRRRAEAFVAEKTPPTPKPARAKPQADMSR